MLKLDNLSVDMIVLQATESFYRAFNAVFGKIGRSSSEEVVFQLINSNMRRVYYMHLRLVQLIKRKKSH